MTKRKRYSSEFKAKVALKAICEELTAAELAMTPFISKVSKVRRADIDAVPERIDNLQPGGGFATLSPDKPALTILPRTISRIQVQAS